MELPVVLDVCTILIFLFVFCATFVIMRSQKRYPPGPSAWPVFGNMFEFTTDNKELPEVFMQYAKKYGNIFRIKFGQMYIVVVNGKKLVHEVLVKRSDVFSNRPDFSWMARQIGTGLILSNGQKWKDLRRVSLHTLRDLGMGKLKMEQKVQDEVKILVEVLSENENKPILMHNYLAMASSNIICSIIFGSRFQYDDCQFQRVLSLLSETLQVPSVVQIPSAFPILRYIPGVGKATRKTVATFSELDEFILARIKEHRARYKKNNNFVDLFLKHEIDVYHTSYTHARVMTIVGANLLRCMVDIFLAGTETLATTLNWSLLFMIAYPDVQTKCQQEIDTVVGRGKNVQYDDRTRLIYNEATLCEIQRTASVVPLAVPHATLEDTSLGGYDIPKQSTILVNLMSVHHDPELWPEPETFNPERFIRNRKLIKPESYIPFSAGPRVCLGESLARVELFLIFTNLLQRFTFSSPEGATINLRGHTGTTRSPYPYKVVPVKR